MVQSMVLGSNSTPPPDLDQRTPTPGMDEAKLGCSEM